MGWIHRCRLREDREIEKETSCITTHGIELKDDRQLSRKENRSIMLSCMMRPRWQEEEKSRHACVRGTRLVHGNQEAGQRPAHFTSFPAPTSLPSRPHQQQTVLAVVHVQRQIGVRRRVPVFAQYIEHLFVLEDKKWEPAIRHARGRLARMDDTCRVQRTRSSQRGRCARRSRRRRRIWRLCVC